MSLNILNPSPDYICTCPLEGIPTAGTPTEGEKFNHGQTKLNIAAAARAYEALLCSEIEHESPDETKA